MKFSLKTIAAAVVMAVAAAGAQAAIDNGTSGNGELFFSIWDANGSYTFDLNKTITVFESDVAAAGAIDQTYALSNFATFLAGVQDTSLLKFNLVAVDQSGPRRFLTTFDSVTVNNPPTTNDSIRTSIANANAFASSVNTVIGAADNVAVNSASAAYAGKVTFNENMNGFLGFQNGGTLADNSYANGMGFMRINAATTGTAESVYNPYVDESKAVRIWIDGNNLHISAAVAAVPEPESYAMLLAGLGMIGFMARRRDKRA